MTIGAGTSRAIGPLDGFREVSGGPRPVVRAKAVARAQLYVAYLLVDAVAIAAAVAVASVWRFGLDGSPVWAQNVLVILAPVYVLLALNLGAFQLRTLVSTAFSIQRAALAFFGALTTALIIIFFLKTSGDYSRLATGYLAIVGGLFIVAGRIGTRSLARRLLRDRVEATVLISEGA